jgi:acyl-CoA thioester hydrolase
MPRITIDLPSAFLFSTELPVRITDINYSGHVGNDRILSLMHEARLQYYRKLGFKDELNFEGAVGQIITDAAVLYKSESFFGDVLVVQLGVTDLNKYGFDILYRLTNKATSKEVAIGKTGIVCFDYERRKVASVPPILLEKLKPSN